MEKFKLLESAVTRRLVYDGTLINRIDIGQKICVTWWAHVWRVTHATDVADTMLLTQNTENVPSTSAYPHHNTYPVDRCMTTIQHCINYWPHTKQIGIPWGIPNLYVSQYCGVHTRIHFHYFNQLFCTCPATFNLQTTLGHQNSWLCETSHQMLTCTAAHKSVIIQSELYPTIHAESTMSSRRPPSLAVNVISDTAKLQSLESHPWLSDSWWAKSQMLCN